MLQVYWYIRVWFVLECWKDHDLWDGTLIQKDKSYWTSILVLFTVWNKIQTWVHFCNSWIIFSPTIFCSYLCLPGRVKVVYVSVQVVLSNCMWAINPIVIEKQNPEVFGQYILRFHISMILVNSVHGVCRLHCITFMHWH